MAKFVQVRRAFKGSGMRQWSDNRTAPNAEFAPPAGASPTLRRSANV